MNAFACAYNCIYIYIYNHTHTADVYFVSESTVHLCEQPAFGAFAFVEKAGLYLYILINIVGEDRHRPTGDFAWPGAWKRLA